MCGADRRRRLWLEARPQAYVLAVSGQEYVWLDGQQRQVKTIVAALPEEGWTRLSAGEGAKGPRWYDWRWLPLADPVEPDRVVSPHHARHVGAGSAGHHAGRDHRRGEV